MPERYSKRNHLRCWQLAAADPFQILHATGTQRRAPSRSGRWPGRGDVICGSRHSAFRSDARSSSALKIQNTAGLSNRKIVSIFQREYNGNMLISEKGFRVRSLERVWCLDRRSSGENETTGRSEVFEGCVDEPTGTTGIRCKLGAAGPVHCPAAGHEFWVGGNISSGRRATHGF